MSFSPQAPLSLVVGYSGYHPPSPPFTVVKENNKFTASYKPWQPTGPGAPERPAP